MTDSRQRAFTLYTPPFRYDHGYIWDSRGKMVADDGEPYEDELKTISRIRGWGNIQYLKNPEALQDEIGSMVAEALTVYWEKNGISE